MAVNKEYDLNPKALIDDIAQSPDFREQRRDGLSVPQAFAKTAGVLIELETDTKTEELTAEGHSYAVMSLADDFEQGVSALSQRGLSKQEAKRNKEQKIIPFNHAVRRMIHAYPDLIFSDVRNLVVAAFVAQNRDELDRDASKALVRIKHLKEQVNNVLQGMRHEIGTQQIAEAAGFIVNSDVTIHEETKGIDMWILMEQDSETVNAVWMPVDAKATQKSADECNSHKGRNAVYSLLDDDDFYNSFRLDDNRARALAPKMKRQLEDRYRAYSGEVVGDFQTIS